MMRSLGGISVLIVEDEIITGLFLCNEIVSAGGRPIGPAISVAAALKAIESRTVDTAILDAKLADGSSADLVVRLEERRIPYVVTSGYEKANLPTRLRQAPFVAKPVSGPLLIEAIGSLVESASSPPPKAGPRSQSDPLDPQPVDGKPRLPREGS